MARSSKAPRHSATSIFELAQFTADDWGMSPGVNDGILDLAERGVIRRVSIVANGKFTELKLERLKRVPRIRLGLHWNISHGTPLPEEEEKNPFQILVDTNREYLPMETHFVKSLVPGLRGRLFAEARRALRGQLIHLKELGIAVDYVDSHQHSHLIPGILNHIAPELTQRKIKTVRFPLDWHLFPSHRLLVCFLTLLSQSVWEKYEFDCLPCIYPFPQDLFDLNSLRRRVGAYFSPEVIVHPAKVADFKKYGIRDSYSEERVKEYEYLRALVEEE